MEFFDGGWWSFIQREIIPPLAASTQLSAFVASPTDQASFYGETSVF